MSRVGYIVVILVWLALMIEFSSLQLFSPPEDILNNATTQAVRKLPERGYIYDRKGKLLVTNLISYDVFFTPSEIKPFDTLSFCNLFSLRKEEFITTYRDAVSVSRFKPYPLITQLSGEEFASIKERLYKYDWLSVSKSFTRTYPDKIAANVLGYIGEVNKNDMAGSTRYALGDYIGKQGVEKQYEEYLRGEKGVEYVQKDKYNRSIRSFKGGIYDTLPVKGKDIKISIDSDLQAYGERLMQNKRGSIVAIDPKTGEILALVSAPTYDPSLLTGRARSRNYTMLYNDTISKPLYDRSLLALYPPGSTFKPLNGLIGLQEMVISPQTSVECNGGYRYGERAFMKCHCPRGTHNDLRRAIYRSCNTYFAVTYRRIIDKYHNVSIGMNKWSDHLKTFGLGNYLGYDLPTGKSGKIPDSDTYDSKYKKARWYSTFTLSNAIGQGEVLVTPIQMANVAAAIANQGFYYVPHLIKEIDNKKVDIERYRVKNYTTIEKKYYEQVIRGMVDVYLTGTASALRVKGINMAGKTGTVENYTRINGVRVKLEDHSTFMAFAPVEDPQIAILVFVENSSWGSEYAGPIASLCIEKYLNGAVVDRKDLEEKMLKANLQSSYLNPPLEYQNPSDREKERE